MHRGKKVGRNALKEGPGRVKVEYSSGAKNEGGRCTTFGLVLKDHSVLDSTTKNRANAKGAVQSK